MTRSGPCWRMVWMLDAATISLTSSQLERAKPPRPRTDLVALALALVGDDRVPGLHRAHRQPGLAPQLEQPAAHQRVLHPVGRVQVPAVAGAAGAAARLVVGHVPARARVVGLLGFPGDDAALDVDLPRAGAGAVHAVGGAHDLVVLPALAVAVLPGPVFARDLAMAVGEGFPGLGEVGESVEEVAHSGSRLLRGWAISRAWARCGGCSTTR